jgi:hypothetical protein
VVRSSPLRRASSASLFLPLLLGACARFDSDAPKTADADAGIADATARPNEPVIVAREQDGARSLALDENVLYWVNDGKASGIGQGHVQRLERKPGATPTTLAAQIVEAHHVNLDRTRVYWLAGKPTECFESIVGSVGKDGVGRASLHVACYGARGMGVDDALIYYLGGFGQLFFVGKDGSGPVLVRNNDETATSLAVGPNAIYLRSASGIEQIPKSATTTGQERLFAVENERTGPLAIDATHLYWTARLRGSVHRLELASAAGASELLSSARPGPRLLALNSTHVYIANDDGTVQRMGKGGGAAETIFSAIQDACALAADDRAVYVSDCGTQTITMLVP